MPPLQTEYRTIYMKTHKITKYKKYISTKFLWRPIFFVAAIVWLELVLKIMCLGTFIDESLLYIALFSVPVGLVCTFFTSLFKRHINSLIATLIMVFFTFWYGTQVCYYYTFTSFYVLDTLALAKTAINNYSQEALNAILGTAPTLILLCVPLFVLLFLGRLPKERHVFERIIKEDIENRRKAEQETLKETSFIKRTVLSLFRYSNGQKIFPRAGRRYSAAVLISAAFLQTLAVIITLNSSGGILSPSAVYTSSFSPPLAVRNFGMYTSTRIEAQRAFVGLYTDTFSQPSTPAAALPEQGTSTGTGDTSQQNGEDSDDLASGSESASSTQQGGDSSGESSIYNANVMDINFSSWAMQELDTELKEMHEYFAQREPTLQNEYTGIFEGKNLIFITAEGFWEYAVTQEYTPTLYKLVNEGFVFENFYNPLWWTSTIDGEFAACTGLFPSSSFKSFETSGANSMPFTMGNVLMGEGYETTAYHNHTYNYYNRDISHPNMGYDYYGAGNGLTVTPTWPASDIEMMEETIPDALSGEMPFHNYYMTISGHLYYTYNGNAIAYKNKDLVDDMDMSEEAKAYTATQIELDKALEYTINELEKAGELENTVICLSADHYPYGLSESTINEFYGGEIDMEFELFRSPLIIWSASMEEPVVIDKICSSVDILPTLLNLFGAEYDSRLLMGRDILSTSSGIAVFSSGSFITENGAYSAYADEFTPSANSTTGTDGDYVLNTFNYSQDMLKMSQLIVKNDYYGVLGLE